MLSVPLWLLGPGVGVGVAVGVGGPGDWLPVGDGVGEGEAVGDGVAVGPGPGTLFAEPPEPLQPAAANMAPERIADHKTFRADGRSSI